MLDACRVLDTATGDWTSLPDMLTPRADHASFVYQVCFEPLCHSAVRLTSLTPRADHASFVYQVCSTSLSLCRAVNLLDSGSRVLELVSVMSCVLYTSITPASCIRCVVDLLVTLQATEQERIEIASSEKYVRIFEKEV